MATKRSLYIALVGYGYWGPKLVRNFRNSAHFTVKNLVEMNSETIESFQFSNPHIDVESSYEMVLADTNIDAIAIATPPHTHFEIAKQALLAGKHVLIEKPFTTSFKDALELVQLALKFDKRLMVDLTFVHNPAVHSIQDLVRDQAKFGEIHYLDSVRINLGIFQSDVNVVWDLACHDVSIFNYILNELPQSVQAIGIDGSNNGIENIAYIHLKYANKFAHINCSWSSPVKVRTMLIGGSKQAILYNDIEPTDKIKIYDKGVGFSDGKNRNALLQDYRTGEVKIPKYDTTEALKIVVDAFYESIEHGVESNSSGNSALLVLFILEMIQKSILLDGKEVIIDWKQVGPSLYSYITNKGMLSEQ